MKMDNLNEHKEKNKKVMRWENKNTHNAPTQTSQHQQKKNQMLRMDTIRYHPSSIQGKELKELVRIIGRLSYKRRMYGYTYT